MRIAQIAPLYESVPPKLYGGTERVVATLSDALMRLGHDVTLFASAESLSLARLHPSRDCAIRLDPELSCDMPAHLVMLEEVRRRADEFDILHFHIDCLQMGLFGDIAGKTVTTLHGRLDLKDLKPFYAAFTALPLVSISDSQRRPIPLASYVATVPHGLSSGALRPPSAPTDDYLAFLGRISPEKRPDRAIEIARRAGWRIKLAAKVDAADRAYFHETIEPLLGDPLVEFVGEIGDAEKPEFLGNARALLFPIDWPEPFGLVMIEAIGCGTPVIAWPCGSAPEVIDEGVTGFLVSDIDAAARAVESAGVLDRRRIRGTFERRFSAEAMGRAYVDVYRRLLTAYTANVRLHELAPASIGGVRAHSPATAVIGAQA
jgi:glycosyltransferase involved in cell wall biosynthesis